MNVRLLKCASVQRTLLSMMFFHNMRWSLQKHDYQKTFFLAWKNLFVCLEAVANCITS